MDLKELNLVNPNTHWYYQAKLLAIKNQFNKFSSSPREICDVGAGSGFFSLAIANIDKGDRVTCVDPNYISEESRSNDAIKFVKKISSEEIKKTSVFLFIDVLDHVEDDLLLLNDYLKNGKPGALVLISVPAFKSLWSYHDEYLEHFRRYTLSELEKVCKEADLEILYSRYLFGFLFPAVWLIRKIKLNKTQKSEMRPQHKLVNYILMWIEKLEHSSLHRNKFVGLSAFVVAKIK